MNKKKKGTLSTILLCLIFLAGLGLLLYPTISDYWNSLRQSRAVSDYAQQVANMDDEVYMSMLNDAYSYNESLLHKPNPYLMTEADTAQYESLLNLTGSGMMGYIEIPVLGQTIPIYHGVEESVLQVAVGHVEWTSLPVGGESTHCVLSGHRGLPSARLFTDLDKMAVGDVFVIRVLDETMTYLVDQILTVEPHQADPLRLVPGEDYCTLVTCTPYGINSHRLLVRGTRIENQEEAKIIRVTADAVQIEPMIVAPIVAVPMLLILALYWGLTTRKKK